MEVNMGVVKGGYSVKLLRITLGLFFLFLGIAGVSPDIGEGAFFELSKGHNSLEILFGVIEIICGVLLLLGLFLSFNYRAIYLGGLIVFIFWIARIVLTRFIWGLNFISKSNLNFPLFFVWLLYFSCELTIAAAIWVVMQRYDS